MFSIKITNKESVCQECAEVIEPGTPKLVCDNSPFSYKTAHIGCVDGIQPTPRVKQRIEGDSYVKDLLLNVKDVDPGGVTRA